MSSETLATGSGQATGTTSNPDQRSLACHRSPLCTNYAYNATDQLTTIDYGDTTPDVWNITCDAFGRARRSSTDRDRRNERG